MAIKKMVPVVQKATQRAAKLEPRVEIQYRDRIDWRSLYLYAVCLITLLISLFALASVIHSIVGLVYPDPIYVDPVAVVTKAGTIDPSKIQLKINKHNSVRGIIDGITTIVIAGPLYLYHWKMVRKS